MRTRKAGQLLTIEVEEGQIQGQKVVGRILRTGRSEICYNFLEIFPESKMELCI